MGDGHDRYCRSMHSVSDIAWINGWFRESKSWRVRVLERAGHGWREILVDPETVRGAPAFEHSSAWLDGFPSENVSFDIPDLSALSPLIEPRELVGRMLPGAQIGDQSIYAVETDRGRLFMPSFLLMDLLWAWSAHALKVILTPNGLDVCLGQPSPSAHGIEIQADRRFASNSPSQLTCQRLSWLSQSADARQSWRSVLANAMASRMDFSLPNAQLTGWAWGVQMPQGLMVCELAGCDVRPNPSVPQAALRIGKKLTRWPSTELVTHKEYSR